MLYLVYFFFFVIFPFHGFCQDCVECPEGFTHFREEHKCLLAFSIRQTWEEALATCSDRGSHLVTIQSPLINGPLERVIEGMTESCVNQAINTPAFWTAGRRKCAEGPFAWVPNHGIKLPMVYTNWLPGEPNNVHGNENCVHFLSNEHLSWNDTPCNRVNCFVCEVDL